MPQYVIDTLKPKNNNNFPVAEAVDVLYEEGSTVKDKIIAINALIVAAQQLIEGIQTDISELQSGKVDKVSGKGLSTNDFTNAYREKIDDTYTKSETDTALAGKVDKVTGKGLSTNDFTNTYKNKVDNTYTKTETDSAIAGKIAEVVAEAPESFDTLKEIADWIDTHADSASAMNSAIQANTENIEKKVDKVEGKTLSSNDFTDVYKNKVDNTYTKTETDTALAGKVDKISGKDLSTNDFTTAYKDKIDNTYTKSESDSITSAISARVAENESDILQLQTDVASKASISALTETNNTVAANKANLQSQIDTLVVESVGDGNAEVVQARIGIDGTTYATLKSKLDSMESYSDDINEKITLMYGDVNNESLWETGNINSNTGEFIDSGATRISTVDYIDSSVEFVETRGLYEMLCHAWEDGAYKGRWIGTGFSTSSSDTAVKLRFVDFAEWRKSYLSYKFKITISKTTNDSIDIANAVSNTKICVDNKYEKYVIKNLFNGIYSSAALLTYDDAPDFMTYAVSEKSKVGIIPAEPNTTYYIQKFDTSDRTKIGIIEHKPKLGDTDVKTVLQNDNGAITSYTVITGETDAFILIQVSASGETPRLCVTKYQTSVFLPYDAYLTTNDVADDEVSNQKTWSSKKITKEIYSSSHNANCEYNWKIGNINSNTGEVIASATTRARTDYLDVDNVRFLRVENGDYKLLCYAWEDDTYIGRFTENGFSADSEAVAVKVTELDVENLQQLYPTYRFKVVASSDSVIDISELVKSILYVTHAPILTMATKMIADDEVSNQKTWSSKQINEKIKSFDDSGTKFYFLEDIAGIYDCPNTVEGGSVSDTVNLVETDATVIYQTYDALAARYPAYITKSTLGSIGDYDIHKYVFNYMQIENSSSFSNKKIKIIINSGLHGYEQGAVWCLLQFLQLLCNTDKTTDQIIKFIRHNVELVVVPIANPYGFSNNQRKNKNGIDVNRNFDAGWSATGTPDTDYYSGTSANSELETQILSKFLDDNSDADYVIDYHNIASGYPMYYINEDSQARLCNSVFVALTSKWIYDDNYEGFPTNRLLGYCKTGSQGTFTRYAVKCGMKAMTLETPWIMPVIGSEQYDKNTIMTGIDVLANTLVAILKSYK